MRKLFLLFVVIGQAIISGAHYLLYLSWVFFFPELVRDSKIILPLLGLLSISFLATVLISFRHNNRLVRFFYLLSAVWTASLLYLIFAAVLSFLVYIVGVTLGTRGNYEVAAAIINGFAVATIIYGLVNARAMRVTQIEVALKNLPAAWKNRVAVMVADLHLGHVQGQHFAHKIVRKINELNPDVIFIPGDFFDGGYSDWTDLAVPFSGLKAKLGAYFVSGNHDKFPENPEHFEALARSGVKILDDAILDLEGVQIVGDGYFSTESPESFEAKLEALRIDKNRPVILLKHVPLPKHLPQAEQAGIGLQLSGHTHRGQTFPFRYITRKVFKGFDYGLKQFGNMMVYTTSGIGTWGPPIRVATKAEIVLIKFI